MPLSKNQSQKCSVLTSEMETKNSRKIAAAILASSRSKRVPARPKPSPVGQVTNSTRWPSQKPENQKSAQCHPEKVGFLPSRKFQKNLEKLRGHSLRCVDATPVLEHLNPMFEREDIPKILRCCPGTTQQKRGVKYASGTMPKVRNPMR